MKKFFSLIAVVVSIFMISGSALAVGAYANSGTDYTVGSNYSANGWFYSNGEANAKAYRPVEGSFVTRNVAGAFSLQKVESNAWARRGLYGNAYTNAYGESFQYSEAYVNPNPGTFAGGGQSSVAGYYAEDHDGWFNPYANTEGNATTMGGTLVGATRFDTNNSSVSMAGALTGSLGHSYAGCNEYDTWTAGEGYVEHGTYANKHGAEAWTGGNASYGYETNGYHHSMGAGLAGTVGMSNVEYTRHGVTAKARSMSFSTNGNTSVNGGTHITSMYAPR
jgi:hypothetical protein